MTITTEASHTAEKFCVYTHLSGHPYLRGVFTDFDAAKALQVELHGQGWYFVPVWPTSKAREERYPVEMDPMHPDNVCPLPGIDGPLYVPAEARNVS